MIYCKQLHTNVTIRAQEHEVVYAISTLRPICSPRFSFTYGGGKK
jgi:hypothetical protein